MYLLQSPVGFYGCSHKTQLNSSSSLLKEWISGTKILAKVMLIHKIDITLTEVKVTSNQLALLAILSTPDD